jgi:hypothetical protein
MKFMTSTPKPNWSFAISNSNLSGHFLRYQECLNICELKDPTYVPHQADPMLSQAHIGPWLATSSNNLMSVVSDVDGHHKG